MMNQLCLKSKISGTKDSKSRTNCAFWKMSNMLSRNGLTIESGGSEFIKFAKRWISCTILGILNPKHPNQTSTFEISGIMR
jgi:hypothetical protein